MNPVMAGDLGIGRGYPPRIMGVLNVSLESPYEPSVFSAADDAVEYVEEELIGEGADIVDIGLASANKRFEVLTAADELDRLSTALEIVDRVASEAVFSIETRYADVAEEALAGGFEMVNDICGFADPEMVSVCDQHGVPGVKMAGPGDIERPGALETVDDIYEALASGPAAEQTIIDPAFGGWSEAKDTSIDRETFDRLREFAAIDRPLLVSINRKNFLRHLADRSTEEALPVSLAGTALAVDRGADVIRTHDVRETRDAAVIGDQLGTQPFHDKTQGVRELTVGSRRELGRHLERIGAGQAAAADGVSHAFELSGIDPVDRTVLASVVRDVGASWVEGSKSGTAILLVTPRQAATIEQRLHDESTELRTLFETVVAAVS